MKTEQPTMSQRQVLQKKFDSGRSNLLLAIILTVVNIVMYFAGSESMLLFSMSVPFYAVIFGDAFNIAGVGIGFAVVVLGLYLLSWGLSKKRPGWLILALVLFILDTLGMAGMYVMFEDVSGLMDGLIHIWVLYYLFAGVSAGKKLKKLPQEDTSLVVDGENAEGENVNATSAPIRRIDEDEKCRVLLESEYGGHQVCYRRVKKCNQLVIDNYIYDEVEMRIEFAHSLCAYIDGHAYEVGFDGSARSFFKVDGEIVAKKIRWY